MGSINSILSFLSIETISLTNLISYFSLEDIRMLPWSSLDVRTFFNISIFNQLPVLLSIIYFFYFAYLIYILYLEHRKAGKNLLKVKLLISQKALGVLPIVTVGILIIIYIMKFWRINGIFERVYDYNQSLAEWLALGEIIGYIGMGTLIIQVALFFAINLSRHLQIRENGIFYGFPGFIPWERISTLEWIGMNKLEVLVVAKPTKKSKFYRFFPRTSKDVISISIDVKEEDVQSLKRVLRCVWQ